MPGISVPSHAGSDVGWRGAAALSALLLSLAAFLTLRDLMGRLPIDLWWAAAVDPDVADARQMLVHYTVLPRIVVALLCGASLALAGLVCQQVLRNPLAEPTTLGVSAGASLALSASALWAPHLLLGREWVALGGSVTAILLVFALAWNRALSPIALVLAGLIVTRALQNQGKSVLTMAFERRGISSRRQPS